MTASAPTGPSSIGDLKRYYELLEAELPVAGQNWPWGDPHRYPQSPHPMGANGQAFQRAALAAGIDVRVGPVAITNGRFGNRSHCIYRGFCLQGCKVNAKASPLITHVPDALAHGAEIRPDCMVSRVEIDDQRRATGIVYFHEGREYRQRARLVAVAGYSIETPRLLLNSACPQFPEGLCNDFDQVGRYVMVQGAPQTTGRYDEEIRSYKAPPPECSSEAFYETDPTKSYKRGFSLQCISPLPIVFAEHVCAQGHWGETLREYMRDSVHWATFGALCEFLPLPENRITLADETDRHGLPVANFSYSLCDNDEALVEAATKVMEDMHHAAGAAEAITIKREAHLIGGCRMAADERDGVVDANLRSFAVPNLFIVDGSVCPTQGSANPALTIMALAARAADYLTSAASVGVKSEAAVDLAQGSRWWDSRWRAPASSASDRVSKCPSRSWVASVQRAVHNIVVGSSAAGISPMMISAPAAEASVASPVSPAESVSSCSGVIAFHPPICLSALDSVSTLGI